MNIDDIISRLLRTTKDYSKEGFVADEKIQRKVVELMSSIKSSRDPALGVDFKSWVDDEDIRRVTASVEYMTSDLGCIITKPYVDCVMQLMQDNIQNNRTGSLIEVGIWKGGFLVMLYYLRQIHQLNSTEIIGIDTFEGLLQPPPECAKDLDFYMLMKPFGGLRIDENMVQNLFREYSIPDDSIRLIKCDICSPNKEVEAIGPISLLRIDVDFRNPTLSALETLYPRVVDGGYVIIDDYGLPLDCKDAVDSFRSRNNITSAITKINHQAIYWQK